MIAPETVCFYYSKDKAKSKKEAAIYRERNEGRDGWKSPSKHPKDKTGLDASAKLTRAKLNKCSGDADLSKDNSGLESPLEFRRSCDKEFVKPWTIEEELALCKAWVSASKDSIEGNDKKASGFWMEVTEYFHKEMGEQKRSYDLVNCKWKNKIHPKILKDHSKWKKVEMPKFYKSKKSSSKKSRTSETTSQGNSDSAHIGLNLNDEAANSEDVDVQEVAPMGRDQAKKKASSSGARSETSIAGDPSLVDALLKRELKLEDQKRREQGELERLKIAQRDKELDLQQKMFEFQQQQKWEEDIKYYNEDREHLTGRALSTALLLKKKIKKRWNLDY
ncbi:hypothetical protein Tco_1103380 [Tanacetum coccineum]